MTIQTDRSGAGQAFIKKIQDADNLPALPAVAFQVLQLTQNQNVSVASIAEVVGQDPVLTAKVLKLVNSSLFGMAKRITSLPQAIVVLGLRTLKVLTLSLSILDSFGQHRLEWFDYPRFWRRCLTQAVAAKLVAKHVMPLLCDDAFVGGLLSDLGILTMAQTARREYLKPYQDSGGNHARLLEAEAAQLGTDHAEVASALLSHWQLPDNLSLAVRLHHRGRQQGMDAETGRLVDLVNVATSIADLFCDGATPEQIQAFPEQWAGILSLEQAQIEGILKELDSHVRESAGLLSVDIGQTTSYAMLQQQTVLQMAEMLVHTELERAQAERSVEVSRKREQQLQKAATIDTLSGLANRAAFDQYMHTTMREALVTGQPLSLLLCDIDHFKRVNDVYGHPVGDRVIEATGKILQEYAGPRVLAARYGGEEFALVLPGCSHRQLVPLAQAVCNRFRLAKVECPKGTVTFRISVGAASIESLERPTVPDLITLADAHLYQAKKQGRARDCVAAVPERVR